VGCRATSLAKARESLKDVAGLELVELDTDKPETVSSAFRGIQLALLVPPSERRVQVANAYVDAAAQARLSFIIVTSTIVGTNESLILGRQWKEIRTCIAASGLPYCFLEYLCSVLVRRRALKHTLQTTILPGASRSMDCALCQTICGIFLPYRPSNAVSLHYASRCWISRRIRSDAIPQSHLPDVFNNSP